MLSVERRRDAWARQDDFLDVLLEGLPPRAQEYVAVRLACLQERIETGPPAAHLEDLDREVASRMGLTEHTVRVYRHAVLKRATALRKATAD